MNSNANIEHSRHSNAKSFISEQQRSISSHSSYTVLPDGTFKKRRHRTSYLELYLDKKNYSNNNRKSESLSNSRYSKTYKNVSSDDIMPQFKTKKQKKNQSVKNYPLNRILNDINKAKGDNNEPAKIEINLDDDNNTKEEKEINYTEVQTLTVSNEKDSKDIDIQEEEKKGTLKSKKIVKKKEEVKQPEEEETPIVQNPKFIQIKEIEEENEDSLRRSNNNKLGMSSSLLKSNKHYKSANDKALSINDLSDHNNNLCKSNNSKESNNFTFPLKSSILQENELDTVSLQSSNPKSNKEDIVETKNQITVSDHVNQEHYDSHEEGNRKESSLNDIKVEDDKSKKEEETVTLQNENHIEQEINPTEETEHNNKIEVGREENKTIETNHKEEDMNDLPKGDMEEEVKQTIIEVDSKIINQELSISPIMKPKIQEPILISTNLVISNETKNEMNNTSNTVVQKIIQPKNSPLEDNNIKMKKRSYLSIFNSDKEVQELNIHNIINKIRSKNKPQSTINTIQVDDKNPELAYKKYSLTSNNKIKQIITNESKSLLKTIQYQKSKGNIRRIKNKTIDFQYNDLPIIDIKKGKQTITLYNRVKQEENKKNDIDEEYNIGKEYLKQLFKRKKVRKPNPLKNFVMPANTLENIIQMREDKLFGREDK